MAGAAEPSSDARRLLDLLAGARIAYLEAFEDGGAELESLTELEEARLLIAEARTLNERMRLLPPEALDALARDLDSQIGMPDVRGRLAALADEVSRKTGLPAEERPPERASAARGRTLYRDSCVGCHGERGAGDGPDAASSRIVPADFTNVVFMRRETPADFFLMIGLGHRRRGMPEWSGSLNVQQRWDLVAYVWGLRQSDADRAAGARIWRAYCAGCHGARGEGVTREAADLTRDGVLDERSDRMLFVGLFRGPHAEPNRQLTDDERWQVVGHLRALSIGGLAPAASPPP